MLARRPALALLALAVLATWASATVVLRLDLAGLVERAEVVLEGEVLSTDAAIDDGGLIVTTVTVLVDDGLLGVDTGDVFRFTIPGGVVGDRGTLIAGMPAYTAGEQVLLLLESESERGLRMPVGLAQGSFRVLPEADGSTSLVRDLGDLDLVDPETQASLAREGTQRFDRDALVATVRRLLAGKASR